MRLPQAPEPRRLRPPVRCGSFTGEGRVEGKGSVSPPHSLLLKTAGTTQGRTCQTLCEDLRAFWVEIRAPEVSFVPMRVLGTVRSEREGQRGKAWEMRKSDRS